MEKGEEDGVSDVLLVRHFFSAEEDSYTCIKVGNISLLRLYIPLLQYWIFSSAAS